MIKYQFLKAENLAEALDIMAEKKQVEILAGGTDLLVDLHKNDAKFENIDYLLDITKINELKGINFNKEKVEIGSLTTFAEIIENTKIQKKIPFLAEAAAAIGSTQIRNKATLGGNLANAAACADSYSPLIVLEAEVVLRSKRGMRQLLLEDFVEWPNQTVIEADEILEKIVFRLPQGEYYSSYQKIGRRKALSISRLSLTLLVEVEAKRVKKAQIAAGAATPYPVPFRKVNKYLNSKSLVEIDSKKAGTIAVEEMLSITGERWSTPYKKPALTKLVERAVANFLEEAEANG